VIAIARRQARFGFATFILGCAILLSTIGLRGACAGEIFTIEVKVADARIDPKTKESIIFVKLTEESKRLLAEITQKNVGKVLEFRLNGQGLMKPIIREPLLAGVFEISSGRSLNEAKEIAKQMISGGKIEIAIVD
jgi:hypothetical protein